MRKIFTLILAVLIVTTAFAQLERPTAKIKKTTVKPKLDGVIDDVWSITDSLLIDRPFKTTNGLPTLGEKGETWWKALWDEDGYYLLVNVTDDAYFPNYVKGSGNPWDYDKIEVYFDVNYVLEDAAGPSAQSSGHHQVAPDFTLAKEDGVLTTETNGRQHAIKVTKPNYVAEYFVPWASLKDKEGITVDKTGEVGFDVTVNDSDPSADNRRRGVWAHSGEDGSEAWSNMDFCGKITFEGAQAGIQVGSIELTGGSITKDNQTLQIVAVVLPEDAAEKSLKWTVEPAPGSKARATIDSKGVVTPILDGVVVVNAGSTDGSFIDAKPVNVTISGQVPTVSELSYIKNGNFDVVDSLTQAPGAPWTGSSTVVDGVLQISNPTAGANPWDWTVGQDVQIPASMKDEPFVFKAKLWADAERIFDVDFELIGDNYERFGDTPDPRSSDGKTQWRFNLTTVPTMYTLEITNFTRMDTRTQKFNLFAGMATPTVYVDSVSLVSKADMALIPTAISQERAMESIKVYPNPAVSRLYVDLSVVNSTVAIYNSVGIKMEEVVVNGTRHEFDVSRYTKGLYFVKA
ncbi:MAG: sugar-binding protein, partial [Draconibacterium sp.]|nr:sugar-binding protein [Draconibacterium sp.]